jgi:integrase
VEEWFERWWPTSTGLRPTTRARDEASFRNHVLPTFGSSPLARLDRTRLREWVRHLSDDAGAGLAPASVAKTVQVLKGGVCRGRRSCNPAVIVADLAPLRVHDLRHTAVALWIAAGANPKQIAIRAGHTSVSVVLDRCGHFFPEQDDALMSALERAVSGLA